MGFLLLAPFFLIRFALLFFLDKSAIRRAAHFPPRKKAERAAYWLYQLSNTAIFVYLLFLQIRLAPRCLLIAGLIVYLAGNLLLLISMVSFASPSASGMNLKGLYRLSRNPIYVAYFVYFSGCALLTQSLVLFGIVVVFQIAAHWVILSEERWCIQNFGGEYLKYMEKVRRYI